MSIAAGGALPAPEWNDTSTAFPSDVGLAQLFEQQAARAPEAIAVEHADTSLTYRELDRRANRLAHRLRRLGLARGSLVGIFVERAPAMIVAMLATLKAGCAYVPLDASYPVERLALMLDDAGARVVIGQSALLGSLPGGDLQRLALDNLAAFEEEPDTALEPLASGSDLAYVMFTSGSTGRPKGACIPQRAVSRLVLNTNYVSVQPMHRVAQASNASFDAATFEIWGALLNGACLVVLDREVVIDAASLAAAIVSQTITTMFITTALFNQIAELKPDAFRGVHDLMFGGEQVNLSSVRRILAHRPRHLIHVYGPTETTTFATALRVEDISPSAVTIPIGRPIANTTAHVLDRDLVPVPIGSIGEIFIGGAGNATGYWRRPELTAARFLPDPFGVPGATLYRTGDLGRQLPDGNIEFVGRVDHQVKVRGFRIELGEVESHIARQAGVAETIVIVREDSPGDQRVVAYVAVSAGVRLDACELETELRRVLPAYMVPSAFVLLDALPLNANGKVDRKALRAPVIRSDQPYRDTTTDTERMLAQIWSDVLHVDLVGADDDFFRLGGHSLLATRVASRVRTLARVELPVGAVFHASTLAALASEIDALRQQPASLPIVRVPRSGALPVSFAQARLWFLDQLDPGSSAYNIPLVVSLEGDLAVSALERAISELVQRHEPLRTRFCAVDGEPRQIVDPQIDVPLRQREASSDDEVRAVVASEVNAPFDLAAGPLLRATLVRRGPQSYVLALSIHHIATDGWSMAIIGRELSALYNAFVARAAPALSPLAIEYPDFASWQRAWLVGPELERQLAFWRKQLAASPAPLELPTDRPRPAVRKLRGSSLPVRLPLALTSSIDAVCRAEGATPFMVLLAAFQALLARWSGQDDVVVGVPIANRTRDELEGLVGFFVNTLALRSHLDETMTFSSLVRSVKRSALAAYAHQDIPFERIVEALGTARDASRTPIFQTMFVLQNAATNDLQLTGVTARAQSSELESTEFDLTLSLNETTAGIVGALEYDVALFDRSTMDRFVEHFTTLLARATSAPEERLSRLSLMSSAERERVVVTWNATSRPFDERPVHVQFEEQARRAPDVVAIVDGGQEVTYGALNRRANRLAHHLVAQGVGFEDRVATWFPRSVEMVVAALAVMKTGASYVPLDPAHPASRLGFIVKDVAAKLVLSTRAVSSRGDLGVVVTNLDALAGDATYVSRSEDDLVGVSCVGRQAAYVIYTSGTTGHPKGAVLEHRALSNVVAEQKRAFGLGWGDRVAQLVAPAFDSAMNELWPTLTSGASLHIVPDDVRTSPEALASWLRAREIVAAEVPTILAESLLEEDWTGSKLRVLTTGGEALRRRPRASQPFRLINQYGPTETTVFVTAEEVVAGSEAVTTIGGPIQNTTAYVLDARCEPSALGVFGEIYIGGVNVGRGYVARPSLTAEKFVPDPFGEAGSRMYRTGDRGRWLADGRIEFAGRNDGQVKIRGFRIELGEVESMLTAQRGVRECVVVAREHGPGDKRLVGYVVAAAGTKLELDVIRADLGRTLPYYMVPSVIVVLEKLPLTPNGKVDRKALPIPDFGAAVEGYVAPRDALESAIAQIWTEVLGVGRIGVHDDFFACGGHSLLATRVVSRVRAAMDLDLSVRSLFEAPTVARFADRLRATSAGTAPVVAIAHVDRSRPIRASFAQTRMWFLEQLEGRSATYNVPIRLRLEGTVDDAVLERCVRELVQRHETLRTTFAAVDGEPEQVVQPSADVQLRVVNASSRDEARALLEHEAHEPFDLAAGPLFRALLVRHAGEQLLVLGTHHIAIDGWSATVLVRELAALYGARVEGKPSPLAAHTIDYADFAVWQRRWLAGDLLADQVTFWRTHLAGAPASLALPVDRPRPAVKRYEGATVSFVVSPERVSAVQELCRREGATPFMVLLAAYQAVLSRWSAQADIVVGTAIANRTRRETESIVGFFVNTLALRTTFADADSFNDVIRQVKRSALAAYSHQDLPFERLVEALEITRDMSRTPVFQAFFAMQNNEQSASTRAGAELVMLEEEAALHVAKFDISLSFHETTAGIVGALEYDVALFDRSTMDRFVEHFTTLLARAASAPEERLSRLSLMSSAERERVVVTWNATSRPFDERPVHVQFEEQARRAPDVVAIVDGGQEVTYGALNRRANRLAHHLVAQGVGFEDRVATWFPRSVEMVVAALAVMKTGASYVPLDPAHPASRLGFIVKDVAAKLVLSTRAVSSRGDLGVVVTNLDALAGDATYVSRSEDDLVGVSCVGRQAAYVIYTSGTTGHPKGAVLEHRALSNVVAEQKRAFGLGWGDRVAQLVAPAFDSAMNELWPTLTSGASLHIVPDDVRTSPEALASWLRAREIVAAEVPTILAESLLEEDWTGSKLRVLTTGGEALRRRPRASQPFRLINQYGPTETTVFVTAEEVVAGSEAVTTIGGPIQNTTAYVLDARCEPSALGVFGEIYIGGVNVGRGYVARPSLTAEKFVPDPFGEAGSRMYRTGDRGRWLADGRIEFAGRNDGQVKIRGFRIELGEVESMLTAQRGVRECVVVAREHGPGDKRLVGYVVAAAGTKLELDVIRADLGRTLPYYMVPSVIVVLEKLPLTPNGKVDRKALPIPDFGAAVEGYVAPRDALEQALCDVFASVLRLPRVGIHDNFFEIGGHSLLASRLMARVAKDLGFSLAVRVVFELPTVAGLASRLGSVADGPALVHDAGAGPLPLSFHQSALWYWEERHSGTAVWNQFNGLRLMGPLDVSTFSRAVDDVRRRHGTLRTTFTVIDGIPMQSVEPPTEGWLEHFDFTSNDRTLAEAKGKEVIAELTGPSDLLRIPLARARLVSVAVDEHWFATSAHRILMDGIIGQEFLLEVVRAYADALDGRPAPPAPLIQYSDYSLWQRKVAETPAFQQRLARYRALLEGARPLALPFDRQPLPQGPGRPRGPFAPCREVAHYAPCRIAAASWTDIDTLAREESTTPFVVAAAAFKAFLATVTGQSDVVIMAQSSLARGSAPELATMLGSFQNFLLLRADIGSNRTLREVVRRERAVVAEARANADLPAPLVLDEDVPWDSPYAVTLNFIPADVARDTWPSVGEMKVELLGAPESHITVRRPRLSWFCEGTSSVFGGGGDLFDEGTVENLADRFSAFLERALREPDGTIS